MPGQVLTRPFQPSDKPELPRILKSKVPAFFAGSEIGDFNHYLDHGIEIYFVVELNRKITSGGGSL